MIVIIIKKQKIVEWYAFAGKCIIQVIFEHIRSRFLNSKLNQLIFVSNCIQVVNLVKFPLTYCVHNLLAYDHG